ncbi:MAG TPA: TIGR03086 family protein [Tessaracoccus flavescens]|uniref:TIGR03086 family protein n=1 Tax=Tessaracoccus flavescens TaxID=399497 RepID=A0A921JRB9_9ACTN|nr:TIGR03086 family protein [Tessaracoccus flavescens]
MANALADNHRGLAAHFAELAAGVTDWDAPTPVKEWKARDIVNHLATWLPGMLGGMGVELPTVEINDDPTVTWAEHTANVQALVDDQEQLDRVVQTHQGEQPLSAVLEQFYLPDIFMHSWDLAKASGQDAGLDDGVTAAMVEGMTPMADTLRESGQFGDPQILDDSYSIEDRLIALIGRDPHWSRDA